MGTDSSMNKTSRMSIIVTSVVIQAVSCARHNTMICLTRIDTNSTPMIATITITTPSAASTTSAVISSSLAQEAIAITCSESSTATITLSHTIVSIYRNLVVTNVIMIPVVLYLFVCGH